MLALNFIEMMNPDFGERWNMSANSRPEFPLVQYFSSAHDTIKTTHQNHLDCSTDLRLKPFSHVRKSTCSTQDVSDVF